MPCCVSEACSRYILTMCGCDGMKKEIVAVTNRKLCSGDFLQQLQRLANSGVAAVILQEKEFIRRTVFAVSLAMSAGSGALRYTFGS